MNWIRSHDNGEHQLRDNENNNHHKPERTRIFVEELVYDTYYKSGFPSPDGPPSTWSHTST